MKRILISGGFGFIGGHLVEHLLASDPTAHVHVVDNLTTSPMSERAFLELIGHPPRLTYSICDLSDYLAADPPRCDEIYHLASMVGPAGILPHAGKMARAIVDDAFALTERALRWQARLLDVSSSEVYGGQSGLCSEALPKVVPSETTVRLEYAIAKLAAETALINTARVTDLDTVIVRPFNIAGPRQSGEGGFVVPRFIDQAVRGEPLTVFGDGTQVRAFTHVEEIASGLRLLMEKGRGGEAYNIGNPDNVTTILGLAERVIAVTGSSSEIHFVDPTTIYGPLYAEAKDKYPDSEKARTDVGLVCSRDLDAIIYDTWQDRLERREDLGRARS